MPSVMAVHTACWPCWPSACRQPCTGFIINPNTMTMVAKQAGLTGVHGMLCSKADTMQGVQAAFHQAAAASPTRKAELCSFLWDAMAGASSSWRGAV